MNNDYKNRNYFVVGCGGLGCYLIEGLLRLDVKKIVVCDPDVFSISNLNRQLYSSINNIGKLKVEVASNRAKELGYKGEFVAYPSLFDEKMLEDIDVVFDALDNISDRLILEDFCSKYNIPIIHGAVEDDMYQVGVCMPHKNLLHTIYQEAVDTKEKHTNVVTIQTCAAKQLSLAMKNIEEFFEIEKI